MLTVVPTPIGNKEDITLRALRHLRDTTMIITENSNTTKKLLGLYDISYHDKQFIKFTSHDNRHIDHIISLLKNQDGLLVSEAWTPWLSDPGKILLIYCLRNHISISVLPGANALIPSVITAGFPTTHRNWRWFMPNKKWRESAIKDMIMSDHASFFYESVHRIEKLLDQLEKLQFNGMISISREISKQFEQHITDTLPHIKTYIKNNVIPLKWEFVIGLYPQIIDEQTQIYDDDTSD